MRSTIVYYRINDISCDSSKVHYNVYGDDTSLLLNDKDLLSLHQNLATELEHLSQWIIIKQTET